MNGTRDQHGPRRLIPKRNNNDNDSPRIGYFAGRKNQGPTNTDTSQPFDSPDDFPTCVYYSVGVKNLIANCMDWNSRQRPTLVDIYQRATQLLLECPDTTESKRIEPLVIHRETHYREGILFPDEDADNSYVFSESSLTNKKQT